MPAVLALISWGLANLPTIITDGTMLAQFVLGARAALTEVASGHPTPETADQIAALDAQLAALESQWATELAAARAAQAPVTS